MRRLVVATVVFAASVASPAFAQSAYDRAWRLPNPIIVIDPYEGNALDWSKIASDPNLKAIIHRAYHGLRRDAKFVTRAIEAKRRGIPFGAYLLGKPGDPRAQADALVNLAAQTGTKFLALDIENMDPASSMTLANAEKFLARVFARTGRYPALYTNWSTYQHISTTYGSGSVFAKAPLWVARFRNQLGAQSSNVWADYTFWQFSSEINCTPGATCLYRVPGTASDMDINVFRGSETALRTLFE